MIDAVLTSHPDALTCGTAKWSRQLAERLGVPCEPTSRLLERNHTLVSVRLSEERGFPMWFDESERPSYDLIVHDVCGFQPQDNIWIGLAKHLYAANTEIAGQIRNMGRHDVAVIWCPSTLQGNPTRGAIDILTFGMAHKVQATHFEKLKALLDRTPSFGKDGDYTISLSTAIHEGKPWDKGFRSSQDSMRDVFGDRLRACGFLADDGLARLAEQSNAIALFYVGGVRQNNTSFWAAVETGKPVITNLDWLSPPELRHNVNVFDIDKMDEWPDASHMREVRHGAQQVLNHYSWDRLIATLKAPVNV